MTAPQARSRQAKPLDAGGFQPEISSFRLHLAAEGKAFRTVRTYTEAVRWSAAARLLTSAGRTRWDEVRKRDVQEWIAWLLDRYSAAYARNQFRALQQFFKWLADEEEIPGSDGRAEAAVCPRQARAGLRRWRACAAGAGLYGPGLPAAPRRGGDRRAQGDRDLLWGWRSLQMGHGYGSRW